MLVFAVALSIGLLSCNNGSNVQSTQTNKQETSQSVQKPVYNPISQWDFSDYTGQKYTLILNSDDGTAQLKYNGKTEYGSFAKSRWGQGLLQIKFASARVRYEAYDEPSFTGKEVDGSSRLLAAQLDADNGYLYKDGNSYEAKDPTRRLKLSKR